MNKRGYIAIFVVSVMLSACDSTTGPSLSVPWTESPRTGTTFTYKNIRLDGLGNPIPGDEYITIDSVVERFTFAGKETVIVLTNPGSSPRESDPHFAYEQNGDISEYMQFFEDKTPTWVTYPIQSINSRTYTLIDTIGIFNGEPGRGVATMELKHSGYSTMNINGTTLVLITIRATMRAELKTTMRHELYEGVADHSFAPELGCVAKVRSVGGNLNSPREKVLIAYTLAE